VSLSVVIALGVAVAAAVYPVREFPFAAPGPDRDEFLSSALGGCARQQRALSQNRDVLDDTINKFCSCYANGMADTTRREDIEYRAKYGKFSDGVAEKMTGIYSECARRSRS
jgi:hypothetical protein